MRLGADGRLPYVPETTFQPAGKGQFHNFTLKSLLAPGAAARLLTVRPDAVRPPGLQAHKGLAQIGRCGDLAGFVGTPGRRTNYDGLRRVELQGRFHRKRRKEPDFDFYITS